jgi:hypothetical protein
MSAGCGEGCYCTSGTGHFSSSLTILDDGGKIQLLAVVQFAPSNLKGGAVSDGSALYLDGVKLGPFQEVNASKCDSNNAWVVMIEVLSRAWSVKFFTADTGTGKGAVVNNSGANHPNTFEDRNLDNSAGTRSPLTEKRDW